MRTLKILCWEDVLRLGEASSSLLRSVIHVELVGEKAYDFIATFDE